MNASVLSVTLLLTLCALPGLSAAPTNSPSTIQVKTLQNTTVIIFDVETTGLNSAKEHIIELAAVRIQGGQITDRQSWLINPGVPVPPATERIHGISTAMLSNAPPFPIVYTQFIAFVQNDVLLAHNARFDRRFLIAEIARHNLALQDPVVHDTLPIFKCCFPGRKSYSLEKLTRDLCPLMIPADLAQGATNVTPRNRQFHSALWDAECTAALFIKAMGNCSGIQNSRVW